MPRRDVSPAGKPVSNLPVLISNGRDNKELEAEEPPGVKQSSGTASDSAQEDDNRNSNGPPTITVSHINNKLNSPAQSGASVVGQRKLVVDELPTQIPTLNSAKSKGCQRKAVSPSPLPLNGAKPYQDKTQHRNQLDNRKMILDVLEGKHSGQDPGGGKVISEGGGEGLSLLDSPTSPSPPISPEELKSLPHPWILDENDVDEDVRNNNMNNGGDKCYESSAPQMDLLVPPPGDFQVQHQMAALNGHLDPVTP